jgi:KDO2-lipid IV(A) lauroyltransferase
LKHLKEKKTVGFVLDQYAGPPIGIRVPFFGVPVGTANIVATLAKRTGAPVLPAISYRTPEGGYRVVVGPALEWISHPDPHQELALNTALYVSTLEGYIRSCPEQWLWTHRRFKGDFAPLRPQEWQEGRARS